VRPTEISTRLRRKAPAAAYGRDRDAGILSALATDAITRRVVEGARAVLNAAVVVVVPTRGGWRTCFSAGRVARTRATRTPAGLAAASQSALATRDVRVFATADPDASPEIAALREEGVAHLLAVPLVVTGAVFGVMLFTAEGERGPFSEQEIELVRSVADTIRQAVENVELHEAEAEAKRRGETELETTRLLLESATALAGSLSVSDVASAFIAAVGEATGRRHIAVCLIDEETGWLDQVARTTSSGPWPRHRDELSDELRAALTSSVASLIDFGHPTTSARGREIQAAHDVRQMLVLPLSVGSAVGGFALLFGVGPAVPFTRREIDVASALAAEASVAMENARRYEREREQAQLAEALNAINQVIASSFDPDDMMRCAVEMARAAMGCESVAISLHVEGGWMPAHVEGLDEAVVGKRHEGRRLALAAEAAATGDLVYACDRDTCGPGEGGPHVSVVVPLIVRDSVIAVLEFRNARLVPFTSAQLDLARQLGCSLSLGLENARLFEVATESGERALEELHANEILLAAADSFASLRLDDVLQTIVEAVRQASGCDRLGISLYDAEHDDVVLEAVSRGRAVHAGKHVSVAKMPPEIRAVFAEKRTSVVDYESPTVSAEGGAYTARHRMRQVLYLPLLVDQALIGMVAVDDARNGHEFSEREIVILEAIASQAAVALENVRLFGEAHEAAALNEALNEIDADIGSSPDLDAFNGPMLERVATAIGADTAALALVEEGGWVITHDFGFATTGVGRHHTNEEMLHARLAVEERRTVVVDDAQDDARVDRELLGSLGVRSVIAVPLQRGDDVFGVMFLNDTGRARRFSPRQVDFATKVGARMSLAVENRGLLAAQRRRVELADALNSVNRAIHATHEIDGVLRHALAQAAQALGIDSGTIHLRERSDWVIRYQHGFDEGELGMRFSAGEMSVSAELETSREPLVLDDVLQDRAAVPETGGRPPRLSSLAVPLFARDELVGIMFLNRAAHADFGDVEVDFGRKLGAAVSLALQNASLFEEQREDARLNEQLTHIDETLHSTLEFDEIVRQVLGMVATAMEAESLRILSRENDGWVVRFVHRSDEADVGRRVSDEEIPHGLLAAGTGHPLAIEDAMGDPRFGPQLARRSAIRSVVAVPLMLRGEAARLLFVNYHTRPHHFTSKEIDFVSHLGASLSLALRNAEAYESEHHVARTLQEALVALPQNVPGILMAHAYQSATHSTRVGGDFYDVFELDHGLLGVVVGDVSGKGLDAAVLTALVKNTLRVHAVVKGNTPAQVVRQVNTVLVKESRPETFVTLFFGILDRRDGRIVFCNAGHPPALVLRGDGSVVRLQANSPIAGAFASVTFADSEAHVGLDELLFLYTDGLTEARSEGQLYGEERVFVQLAREADTEPEGAITRVMTDCVAFAGGRLSDDVAVLAVKRVPLPASTPVQQKLALWGKQRV
jgi:GAF domain-containing protein